MPSFRFLHASDFHLERPPCGLSEAPDHLGELLIEAAFRAAANVFDAALERDVDFVVLAGDLVAPERSGPRAILFLRDQFARLAERDIGVFWAGGSVDRVYAWPAAIGWPANVHIFQADVPQNIPVTRRGQSLCKIIGQSQRREHEIDVAAFAAALSDADAGRFKIGLAYGDFDEARLHSGPIDYWALGGEHEPTLPLDVRPLVHYPGSPQARSPAETGPHGCTLVQVTDEGEIRTTPLVTDVVRYWSEPVMLPPSSAASAVDQPQRQAAAELERLLRQRLQALADANPAVTQIVSFTLTGDALPYAARLALPLPAITGVLRGEFGYRSPPVWLDRVRLPHATTLAESWYQEETLRGDFLRAARRLASGDSPIDLNCFLPDGRYRELLCGMLPASNSAIAEAALDEAVALGAGLLSAEEAVR